MRHQRKHIRKSKRGKHFVAGRGLPKTRKKKYLDPNRWDRGDQLTLNRFIQERRQLPYNSERRNRLSNVINQMLNRRKIYKFERYNPNRDRDTMNRILDPNHSRTWNQDRKSWKDQQAWEHFIGLDQMPLEEIEPYDPNELDKDYEVVQ